MHMFGVGYQLYFLLSYSHTTHHLFYLTTGVVPTKTKVMAERLVKIIMERLLSLQEAFGRLQPDELSALLLPAVSEPCDAILARVVPKS
jgi:hypothetical protein